MVKKKAPFIPVTLIVLGAGFAFAMNARSRPIDPEEEARIQREKASEADRPKVSPDVLTQQLKPAAKRQKLSTKKLDGSVPVPSQPDDGPGPNPMLVNKVGHYKPTFNPTSADAQWYHTN